LKLLKSADEREQTRESRRERADKREQARESRQERAGKREQASADLHHEVVLEAPEEVERGQQQQPCHLDILRWASTLCDGHRYLQTHRNQYAMVFRSI
jgi:hypothetical protein